MGFSSSASVAVMPQLNSSILENKFKYIEKWLLSYHLTCMLHFRSTLQMILLKLVRKNHRFNHEKWISSYFNLSATQLRHFTRFW
jgi:hypothetical protein